MDIDPETLGLIGTTAASVATNIGLAVRLRNQATAKHTEARAEKISSESRIATRAYDDTRSDLVNLRKKAEAQDEQLAQLESSVHVLQSAVKLCDQERAKDRKECEDRETAAAAERVRLATDAVYHATTIESLKREVAELRRSVHPPKPEIDP